MSTSVWLYLRHPSVYTSLNIIRVLRIGCVSAAYLVAISVALVRSVLEYCCVV